MIDRLKVIMEKEGLTPSQLADKLHIQRSGLSHILSGRNNPSLDFVKKVLTEFPQYGMEWFIFGDTNVNSDVYKCDTNVNSAVYKSEHEKELSLFGDEVKSNEFTTKFTPSPREIPQKNEKNQSVIPEKAAAKKLVKIIMVYDNRTFEELIAE